MQTLPRSGITVKQYGKFHIRAIQPEGEQASSERLQISLERSENNRQTDELFLGYIRPQPYDFSALRQCIRFWLMEMQGKINQATQWVEDTQDQRISAHLQQLTNMLETNYREVSQALQEIDVLY